MNIKKFKQFGINEGIDRDRLTTNQLSKLKELEESDVSIFGSADFEYFADEIGVSIEDIMEFVADGGTYRDTNSTNTETMEDVHIEELVQKELIDNPDVNQGNIRIKIDELIDKMEQESLENYYLDNIESFEDIKDLKVNILKIYNKLNGSNNPDQISMKFESIKRFNNF